MDMILCGFNDVCSTAAKSSLLKGAKITSMIAVSLSPVGCGIAMDLPLMKMRF
jgi:hypothetical protein